MKSAMDLKLFLMRIEAKIRRKEKDQLKKKKKRK